MWFYIISDDSSNSKGVPLRNDLFLSNISCVINKYTYYYIILSQIWFFPIFIFFILLAVWTSMPELLANYFGNAAFVYQLFNGIQKYMKLSGSRRLISITISCVPICVDYVNLSYLYLFISHVWRHFSWNLKELGKYNVSFQFLKHPMSNMYYTCRYMYTRWFFLTVITNNLNNSAYKSFFKTVFSLYF